MRILWGLLVHTFMILTFQNSVSRLPSRFGIGTIILAGIFYLLVGLREEWRISSMIYALAMPGFIALSLWVFDAIKSIHQVMIGFFLIIIVANVGAIITNEAAWYLKGSSTHAIIAYIFLIMHGVNFAHNENKKSNGSR